MKNILLMKIISSMSNIFFAEKNVTNEKHFVNEEHSTNEEDFETFQHFASE